MDKSAASGHPVTPHNLRLITIVLASACGLAVANIYYAQPLLGLIATSLHSSQGATSAVVTAAQLGYAIGLVLLLPLGDLLENRALTSRLLIVASAALLLAGFAPNLGVFLVLSVLIGVTSVVAQILIPLAAHLAPPEQRGRFVGQVMAGLLLGILLARTVSSLVASAWGWRAIYFISAGLMVLTAVALRLLLPERRPERPSSYRQLMASVVRIAREEPVLRRRAICQGLMFGAFVSFWTSITFELIDAHGLSQFQIAMFALVGAAGALAAPIAGRLADRGHGRVGSGAAFALAIIAMVIAGAGSGHIVALAAAAVVLDLATQGHQVFSQQEIYALRADARARINTVFMGTVFTCGAISSATSGWLYESHGWGTVTIFASAMATAGLLIWAGSLRSRRRGRRDSNALTRVN
jgi:predicted MFS family arabinose efflux permease